MFPLMNLEQAKYVEKMVQRVTLELPSAPDRTLKARILERIAEEGRSDAAEIVQTLRGRWGF